jgi:hypothetical protein
MSVSHWTHSKPIFEMAEAAFAEAIFIGLQSPGTDVGDDFRQVPPTQWH